MVNYFYLVIYHFRMIIIQELIMKLHVMLVQNFQFISHLKNVKKIGVIIDEIFNYSDFTNSNIYWGINSEDLEYYLDTDLQDQNNDFSISDDGPAMYYSVDNQEIISEHEFMIKYKHSSGNSTIDLGGFMIVEGSETVTLNGTILNRGVDYTIDYFSGYSKLY